MIAKPRVYFSLSFLAAGIFLAPFIPTDSRPIDWRAMADAYEELIFADGFDDGTTDRWTTSVSGKTVRIEFSQGSTVAEEILTSMDSFGRAWVPTAILVEHGYDGRGFNAGPKTLVDDCNVRIDEAGNLIVTFSLPADA